MYEQVVEPWLGPYDELQAGWAEVVAGRKDEAQLKKEIASRSKERIRAAAKATTGKVLPKGGDQRSEESRSNS